MVLGIGGVRVLKEFGIKVDVYYFNEGYVVFVGFEFVRYYMEEKGFLFEQVLLRVREKIVFIIYIFVEVGNEIYFLRLFMYMGVNLNLIEEQFVYIGGVFFNMMVVVFRFVRILNVVFDFYRIIVNVMWV